MTLRRLAGITLGLALAASLFLATPASAGDLGLFGTFWDTDALGETAGGGVKYAFGDGALRLDLRGSYYPDLSRRLDELLDDGNGRLKTKALVPEVGISFNLAPRSSFQPYFGAGLSYYVLDTNRFNLDDEVGFYGLAGLNVGGGSRGPGFFAELLYRSVEGTLKDDSLVDGVDLDLSGPALNAGVTFRF